MNNRLIIATIKSWNIENAKKLKKQLIDFDIDIISDKKYLSFDYINKINPRYIFFPHWSWIIPKNIYKNFECVVFHITDLPYGRGGSPLQNLIINKQYETKISALKVSKDVDAGTIYYKIPFSVKNGSANEILQKASDIIFFKMITYILEKKPTPVEQKGDIVIFKRRKSEESDMQRAQIYNLNDFYNFIRMLDGEGYPNAFIKLHKHKILFSKVINNKSNELIGKFKIIKDDE